MDMVIQVPIAWNSSAVVVAENWGMSASCLPKSVATVIALYAKRRLPPQHLFSLPFRSRHIISCRFASSHNFLMFCNDFDMFWDPKWRVLDIKLGKKRFHIWKRRFCKNSAPVEATLTFGVSRTSKSMKIQFKIDTKWDARNNDAKIFKNNDLGSHLGAPGRVQDALGRLGSAPGGSKSVPWLAVGWGPTVQDASWMLFGKICTFFPK